MISAAARLGLLATLVAATGACATKQPPAVERPFDLRADTLSYPNELAWEYGLDADGKWTGKKRDPAPDYTLRCFVLARTARQFFANARFDPTQPVTDDETYRRLIRRVVKSSPRHPVGAGERIVIPGFSNLRAFSEAQAAQLKAEAGGAWRSYFQRGNWRMIFPFSRDGQESVAQELGESLRRNWPPVVHVVTFPDLALNHAVLVVDAKTTDEETVFLAYDPNDAQEPIAIHFDRLRKRFVFPRSKYWIGGPVNVYEVYRGPLY